jgi:signal transduction histidine kinase
VQLRQRFRLLLGLQVALALGLAALTAALFRNQQALSAAQRVHFESYRLADELRQSSDDLTRLARSFVATGDEEFARQYQAVLDIRNGRRPRPADYERIYWDLVTKERPQPRPDGATASLHDLMVREGFTAAEFARLAAAQKYSDALAQTEMIAMNAARGRFDDGAGGFTVKRTPDRARATEWLHDQAYHDKKAKIMQPIDDFYVMFAQRTAGEVAKFERRARLLLAAMGANLVAILGLFGFSYVSLRRQMLERERAQDALSLSEERYRSLNVDLEHRVALRTDELAARHREMQVLLESVPDTVVLCDGNGTMMSAHAPAGSPDGDGAADARHDVFVQQITGTMHHAAHGRDQTVVQEFDGERHGVPVSVEARATRVGPNRVLILIRDISARKRSERDVLRLLERERQLSEMKSQFMTVASHEFRTPLATAVGSVELLQRHADRLPVAKRAELFARIQGALDRLTSIMDDMLMLTRADSGRMTVNRMEVDLARFVADLIQRCETNDGRQHLFSFDHLGGPAIAPADTSLLHHVLSNLLENAVRYSPAGSRVAVTLDVEARAFAVTITDEGIGVPDADRERIFEPFVRGANVGQVAGTGLGLNLARRYTQLMGGRIELLPAARGAVFRVTIPLQQPPA